jgi:hypothetical protein
MVCTFETITSVLPSDDVLHQHVLRTCKRRLSHPLLLTQTLVVTGGLVSPRISKAMPGRLNHRDVHRRIDGSGI